jgi:ABC-2 type transport system ATP-binding protein
MSEAQGSRATRWLGTALAAVLVAVVVTGCSDRDGERATKGDRTEEIGAAGDVTVAHECDQGATEAAVTAVPVPGTPSDFTVTSFDGTELRTHWFPTEAATEDEPTPTVLMGPGWGQPGDTSTEGAALFGALGIGAMNAEGYNVLTWDPRGFGRSTGTSTVNDAGNEGRDVQVLLDWVASRPEALTDDDGDPRVGMVGLSYGGGIQLTTAAIDCRVDVIVPGLAWHSLETSLFKSSTVKIGWAGLLTTASAGGRVDPHSKDAYDAGLADGSINQADRDWFIGRGPGDAVDRIDIPTLLIQGTVDTLFTLDEAITNFRALRANDVPTKMLWFCGGHGTCLTDTGDQGRVAQASTAWLDRYLKGDESVDTGPAVDLIDQDGTRWTGEDYPPETGTPITAEGDGTLKLVADGGSGPATGPKVSTSPLDGLVTGFTPAPAANSVDVPIGMTTDAATLVVGPPKLSLTYRGTSPGGAPPTRVFAQLVDDERHVVVGNQITPIEVTLDGETHSTEVDLEVIAQRLDPGQTLTLQLVATSTAYAPPRLGGEITFERIGVELPVAEGLSEG